MKNRIPGPIARFFSAIYQKLFKIDDSPQKIAVGFALGVVLGIMPAMGPVAALCAAFIFRVNRASALLGSILTNTWLSIILFLISIRVGALITGIRYADVYNEWIAFAKDFHWAKILQVSLYKLALPVITGYIIVAVSLGLVSYIVVLAVARRIADIKKARQ